MRSLYPGLKIAVSDGFNLKTHFLQIILTLYYTMEGLNADQRKAVNIAVLGHNLLILGKVRAGKTHTLR